MKKLTVAIDSFKGSLTSKEAADAVCEGALSVYPDLECAIYQIADGGEGTVAALSSALGAEFLTVDVTGPLFEKRSARYSIADGTAYIEMAEAAGLPLVPENRRNPLHTTTYGVGEMMLDAIRNGAKRIVVGIGGSATNDGGVGMLAALGFRFLNSDGESIALTGGGLSELAVIDVSGKNPLLDGSEIITLCDVNNPLLGKNGASHIYGGQKGADEPTRYLLDEHLTRYAELTEAVIPSADRTLAGGGAAGGLGYAMATYLESELLPGIDAILRLTGAADSIQTSDLVITGEGRLDLQSFMGKAPSGVASIAKAAGVPCIAFAGRVDATSEELCNIGINGAYPITPEGMPLEVAMQRSVAYENLKSAIASVLESMKAKRGFDL